MLIAKDAGPFSFNFLHHGKYCLNLKEIILTIDLCKSAIIFNVFSEFNSLSLFKLFPKELVAVACNWESVTGATFMG